MLWGYSCLAALCLSLFGYVSGILASRELKLRRVEAPSSVAPHRQDSIIELVNLGARVSGLFSTFSGASFFRSIIRTGSRVQQCHAQRSYLIERRTPVTTRAAGSLEVKLSPVPLESKNSDASLGRLVIDKQFCGDLEGISKGEMLTASTSVKGSAGYVAIEQVTGSLHGKNGSFVLQHSGTMKRGFPQLSVTVVPDSGSGELTGLTGTMIIDNAEGKHSYDFEYKLDSPDADL